MWDIHVTFLQSFWLQAGKQLRWWLVDFQFTGISWICINCYSCDFLEGTGGSQVDGQIHCDLSFAQMVAGSDVNRRPSKSNIWFINTVTPETRRAVVLVITGRFRDFVTLKSQGEKGGKSIWIVSVKCQVLVFSWEEERKRKNDLNNTSVSFAAALPNSASLSLGSSLGPLGRNLLWCTATHSTLYIHHPCFIPHACACTCMPDHHHAWWIVAK